MAKATLIISIIIGIMACIFVAIGVYYGDFELIALGTVALWLIIEAVRFIFKPLKQETPDDILRKIARKYCQ